MTRNMLSACRSVLAFTHICTSTQSHTHTHHKVLDVTLNCLGRVWPAVVILWTVAMNAHFDIQLLCSLQVSLQWREPQQVLVILCHYCEETRTPTVRHHWSDSLLQRHMPDLFQSFHYSSPFVQWNLYIYRVYIYWWWSVLSFFFCDCLTNVTLIVFLIIMFQCLVSLLK